MTVYIQ